MMTRDKNNRKKKKTDKRHKQTNQHEGWWPGETKCLCASGGKRRQPWKQGKEHQYLDQTLARQQHTRLKFHHFWVNIRSPHWGHVALRETKKREKKDWQSWKREGTSIPGQNACKPTLIFVDVLNSLTYYLIRSVDQRWLFDRVLHSSLFFIFLYLLMTSPIVAAMVTRWFICENWLGRVANKRSRKVTKMDFRDLLHLCNKGW